MLDGLNQEVVNVNLCKASRNLLLLQYSHYHKHVWECTYQTCLNKSVFHNPWKVSWYNWVQGISNVCCEKHS